MGERPRGPRLSPPPPTSRSWLRPTPRSWLAQAVAAVNAGSAAPRARNRFRNPRPRSLGAKPPARPEPPRIQPDVASVAQGLDERRLRGPSPRRPRTGRAGPPHRRGVPRPLVRAPHRSPSPTLSYLMAHEWLLRLVGRDPGRRRQWAAGEPLPGSRDGDGELGLAEAAKAAGVSLPTVRRRWRAGQLPAPTATTRDKFASPPLRSPPSPPNRAHRSGCRRGTSPTPCGCCAGSSPSPGPTVSSRPASTRPKASTPPSLTRRRPQRAPGGQTRPLTLGECARPCFPPAPGATSWRSGCSGSWACASRRPSGSRRRRRRPR